MAILPAGKSKREEASLNIISKYYTILLYQPWKAISSGRRDVLQQVFNAKLGNGARDREEAGVTGRKRVYRVWNKSLRTNSLGCLLFCPPLCARKLSCPTMNLSLLVLEGRGGEPVEGGGAAGRPGEVV